MATRKEKQDDQVIDVVEVKGSNATTGQSFLEQNQKNLSYLAMALGAIAVILVGYKFLYKAPQEKEAINLMYKAEELFAKDSFAVALESPTGAYDGFLSIIDGFGGTKAGNLAKYYAGVCYLNLGKYKEAVDYLEDYDANDEVTEYTKAGVLGDAHAELGDKAKALSYYTEAASSDNELIAPYYLHKLAMLSYTEGKKDEAIKHLLVIQEKYPDSPEYREAEKLLARIQ